MIVKRDKKHILYQQVHKKIATHVKKPFTAYLERCKIDAEIIYDFFKNTLPKYPLVISFIGSSRQIGENIPSAKEKQIEIVTALEKAFEGTATSTKILFLNGGAGRQGSAMEIPELLQKTLQEKGFCHIDILGVKVANQAFEDEATKETPEYPSIEAAFPVRQCLTCSGDIVISIQPGAGTTYELTQTLVKTSLAKRGVDVEGFASLLDYIPNRTKYVFLFDSPANQNTLKALETMVNEGSIRKEEQIATLLKSENIAPLAEKMTMILEQATIPL